MHSTVTALIERCSDDMFLWADTEVAITLVPSTKTNTIFPLAFALLQKIRCVTNKTFIHFEE